MIGVWRLFSRHEDRSTIDRVTYLFIVFVFALFAALREFFSYSLESSLFGWKKGRKAGSRFCEKRRATAHTITPLFR